MTAKTHAERQAAYRARKKKDKQIQRYYWAIEEDHEWLKQQLENRIERREKK